jgi:hypothetical protein
MRALSIFVLLAALVLSSRGGVSGENDSVLFNVKNLP